MAPVSKTLGLLLCGAAAGVLLSGCKPGAQEASAADAPPPLAALPLTDVSTPQGQPGPLAVDLPRARPARLGPPLPPGDGYAYLDRAYFLNDAFGEAPPDYEFDYSDEAPWAWETDDGYIRIAEFLPYGVRYYYYEPGYDEPFLIHDPDYDYAYARGELVAVYDSEGGLLPSEDYALHASTAGRELSRAEAIFRNAGRERQPVALDSWTARRGQITSDIGRWRQLEGRQSAWRSYHQAHLKAEQAHWAPEGFRRAAETARIDRQIHDPDGAQHALSQAREAQNIARKAHVTIAMAPSGRANGASAARLASASPPPGRAGREMAMLGPALRGGPEPAFTRGQAPGFPRGQALRFERGGRAPAFERGWARRRDLAERAAAQRLAMASLAPRERALYDVRAHGPERPPVAFAGPRMRAAEQFRAARQFAPIRGPDLHPAAQAAPPREAPHLRIVQAGHDFAPHGGDGRPGGGDPGGGGHPEVHADGGHGGGAKPEPQHKGGDRHH